MRQNLKLLKVGGFSQKNGIFFLTWHVEIIKIVETSGGDVRV